MNYCIKIILLVVLCYSYVPGMAQRKGRAFSLAVTNSHSAYPFNKFASLFTKEFHPGVELGYEFNWKTKPKHDWFQSLKAGYFYHQFVQHAIPVYTQFGYRYKLKEDWRFKAAIGAGYLHSIPDAAILKLNEIGEYENDKGVGRGQALINFSVGAQYGLTLKSRLVAVFINYQQQLQTPFINSYVPLLPYNSIALGVSVPLNK